MNCYLIILITKLSFLMNIKGKIISQILLVFFCATAHIFEKVQLMDSNDETIFPPKTVIDKFVVSKHVGHGGYGEIYSVYTKNGRGPYAMKVEFRNAKKHGLTSEVRFLKQLQDTPLFPKFYLNGKNEEIRYYIMELLGPSTSAMRRILPEQRMSKYTVTVLAKEMLKCIEELHFRGYIHRDIKPGNFLIRPDRKNPICLIDFGLSKSYLNKNGQLLKQRDHPGFVGTCSFASIYAHDGEDLSRRDDLISWFYSVIELVQRRLPWPGSKDREETYRIKKSIEPEELCKNLPKQFLKIFNDIMKLEFHDKPNYNKYFQLIDDAIDEMGMKNRVFDWEKLPKDAVAQISPIPLIMEPSSSYQYYSEYEEEEEEEEDYEPSTQSFSAPRNAPTPSQTETNNDNNDNIKNKNNGSNTNAEKDVKCKCTIY